MKLIQVTVANSSLAFIYFLLFASRFPLPHFTFAVFIRLSPLSFSFALAVCLCRFLACLCACLFVEVIMAENTKLCDFSSTNNNDFISTPIAPATSAELYEINAALLNLVMKEQFSGLPSEDAASHLNTFIELCYMQKKKDVDNDVIKLKLFPFSL